MLNLNDLINSKDNKNIKVLGLSNGIITEDGETNTFEYFHGCLCGGENEGLLIEESQEMLFITSKINSDYTTDGKAILTQNGEKYSITLVNGYEGVSIENEHLNFNTLIKIKTDDDTNEIVECLVKINELTRRLDLKNEIKALKLIDELAEQFEITSELENALDNI